MVWIDGVAGDHVPADDRGLQFGDGLFETVAVVDHRPQLLDAHVARLCRDARTLRLPAPDPDRLRHEATHVAAQGMACGVLKILWTAGSGGRGYARPPDPRPRRIMSLHPAPAHPAAHWDDGVAVALCSLRLARQPALAGIKHLNRLEQVLAREEWGASGAAEGIMRDQDDWIIEGSMSNLFAVREGQVVTPRLDTAGVAGVMRDAVMARLDGDGRTVEQTQLSPAALGGCDEVFLCNSVNGVWPVRELQGTGTWSVGPVTRELQAWVDGRRLACTPIVIHGRKS